MQQRKFFIKEYRSGLYSKTELAERFGISRKTVHKFIKRYEVEGAKGLDDKSRAPHTIPHKTPEQIIKLILALRKKKKRYGARKIRKIVQRENPHLKLPPISTVNSILNRHGKTKPRKRIRRIIAAKQYHQAQRPCEIWTADYKGHFALQNRQMCYPLTICDMHSRFILGIEAQKHPNGKLAKAFFTKLFRKYGMPKYILTDNGAPFVGATSIARLSKLAAWWIKLGITPLHMDPGCPQQNGKHERMHKDLKADTAVFPKANIQAQQRTFNRFVKEYNTYRPHEALNDDTPAEHFIKSKNKYTGKFIPYNYPKHFVVRRVSRNGAIRWPKDRWLTVSTTIIEDYIGLERIDLNYWCVWFHNIKLGYFHERNLRIEDYKGRITRSHKAVNRG